MIAIATLALFLSAPAAGAAAADPDLPSRVEPLLGTIDRPVTPAAWRALPPEARPLLEAIAADPGALPTRRAAALAGVSALGGDGSVHRRLARDPAAPFLVRLTALQGLPSFAPASERAAVVQPFLASDPDVRIRAAAAELLGGLPGAAPCAAVRAQVRREAAEAHVRFERALATCEGR